MKIISVIPARMSSTRFPGKPLAKILGIPMIGHVYFRARMSKTLDQVYIATCDREIMDYAASIGAKAVFTKDTHQRASDRVAEAVLKIERKDKKKSDIVVMLQGDEPMLRPEMINAAVRPFFLDKNIQVVNLMGKIKDLKEYLDPNQIKVVVDSHNFALYFSREPIPSAKKTVNSRPRQKQVCIIPFRRDFLLKFSRLKPTPLEIAESVDMLRVLEHGYQVKMVPTPYQTHSVDTIADLKQVAVLMKKDRLLALYKSRIKR